MADGAKLATAYYELIATSPGAETQISNIVKPAASKAGGEGGSSIGEALLGGLKKFALPIAGIFAGLSVKKFVNESTEAFMSLAGSVNGLQRIAGGTKEQVSGLRGALQLSGVDADTASGSLTIFSKNLGKAAADGDAAAAMSAKLGTSFLDATGAVKPMSEILPGLSDTFKAMPDGAEKTALATSLFGRAGTQMLPFLNKGSAGIAELTLEAAKMGLVIDDVSAKTFANAKVSAREYSSSIQGLKVTFGGVLLPVLTAVQNVFRNAFIPIIQSVTGLLQDNRDKFLAVADSVGTFGEAIGGKVQAGLTIVEPALRMFFIGIGEGASTLGSVLGPEFAQLGPVFSSLLPQIIGIWQAFSPLSLIMQSLGPIIPTLVGLLVTLATTVLSSLGSALSQVLPAILSVGQVLAGVLTGSVQTLLPVIVQLVTMLAGLLSGALTAVLPVVAQLAGVLAGVLGSALTTMLPIIQQVVAILAGALLTAFNALMPAISTLLPIVGQIASTLGTVLGTALQALTPIISLVAQVFGQVLAAVAPLITPLLGLLTPILGLIEPLLQLVSPLLLLVGSILTPLIDLFTQLLTPILGLIEPLLGLLVPVLGFVADILAVVIGWIVQLITWLVGLISGNQQVYDGISTVWNNILSFFGTVFGAIGSFFTTGWNTLVSIVSLALNNIRNTVSTIWTNVVSFFSTGITNIVSFFTGLPGQIMTAIGGLGSMLFNSGKAMIQGLLDGAGSLLKNIGTFFLNVVPAFIREPFKAALGIHSPSRVFAGYGQNITEGLLIGVNEGRSRVAATMANLVQVPDVAAFGTAGVFGAANARGKTEISVTEVNDPIGTALAIARRQDDLEA